VECLVVHHMHITSVRPWVQTSVQQNNFKRETGREMAQVVEPLINKHKALSSHYSTASPSKKILTVK
jgi:hypothetical protein